MTCCPLKVIPAEAWDAFEAARWSEHGKSPCGHGYLDETAWWGDAVQFVKVAKAHAKAEAEAGR